ncbi:MAG: hypothetical protein ACPGNT_08090 [Rhodospirillales bacterium]
MGILEAGFGLFRHDEVAIGLSLLILAAGVFFLARLWFRIVRPICARLDDAIRAVEAAPDAAAFARTFDALDEKMSADPLFRGGWRAFASGLIPPVSGDGVGKGEPIRYTRRPGHFLNTACAEGLGINLAFQRALPNYFVGFGLLFTFLGLVAALFFATQGVSSPNIAVAQGALRDLLHAATFKFLTSVSGLSASLAIGIANRLLLHRLQSRFDALCTGLEDRLAFVTSEAIQVEQVRQTVRQSKQFGEFRQAYAAEAARALRQAQEPLAETVAGLDRAMMGLADNLKDMNKDALAQMAQAFIDALSETAAKELNAIAATLDGLNGELARLSQRLDETGQAFGARIEGAGVGLETGISAASKALAGSVDEAGKGLVSGLAGASEDAGRSFRENAAAFAAHTQSASESMRAPLVLLSAQWSEMVEHYRGLNDRLARQFALMESLTDGLRATLGGLSETTTALGGATEPIVGVAKAFKKTAQDIGAGALATAAVQERLEALAARVEANAAATAETWSQYRTQFETVSRALAETLCQAAGDIHASQERAESTVDGLDGLMGRLGQRLDTLDEGLQALRFRA